MDLLPAREVQRMSLAERDEEGVYVASRRQSCSVQRARRAKEGG